MTIFDFRAKSRTGPVNWYQCQVIRLWELGTKCVLIEIQKRKGTWIALTWPTSPIALVSFRLIKLTLVESCRLKVSCFTLASSY